MKPRELLGSATTPAGEPITLAREGGHLVVRVRGVALMSSAVHGSEEEMAEIGCRALAVQPDARVLIGGLGMGFTLRAALDACGPSAQIVVAELVPAVAEWNRGPLADVAGRPLDDPRVRLVEGDVADTVREASRAFDAILLDVDNGPEALSARENGWLYGERGLAALHAALRPAGVLVVWSAFESPRFEALLRRAFTTEVVRTRARSDRRRGSRHTLYVGRTRHSTQQIV